MPLLQEMKQLNILCWENVDGCAQTTTRDKMRRVYYNKFVLCTTAKYATFSYNQFFGCAMTCAFAHDVHMHLQLCCFKLYLTAFLTVYVNCCGSLLEDSLVLLPFGCLPLSSFKHTVTHCNRA